MTVTRSRRHPARIRSMISSCCYREPPPVPPECFSQVRSRRHPARTRTMVAYCSRRAAH